MEEGREGGVERGFIVESHNKRATVVDYRLRDLWTNE